MKGLFSELQLVGTLQDYSVEFGILQGDKIVKFQDLDMRADDAMYFIEYGTLTSGAFHILQRLEFEVINRFDIFVERLLDKIFDGCVTTEIELHSQFIEFEAQLNAFIKSAVETDLSEIQYLESKESKDESTELTSLKSVLGLIRCKITKKFS